MEKAIGVLVAQLQVDSIKEYAQAALTQIYLL